MFIHYLKEAQPKPRIESEGASLSPATVQDENHTRATSLGTPTREESTYSHSNDNDSDYRIGSASDGDSLTSPYFEDEGMRASGDIEDINPGPVMSLAQELEAATQSSMFARLNDGDASNDSAGNDSASNDSASNDSASNDSARDGSASASDDSNNRNMIIDTEDPGASRAQDLELGAVAQPARSRPPSRFLNDDNASASGDSNYRTSHETLSPRETADHNIADEPSLPQTTEEITGDWALPSVSRSRFPDSFVEEVQCPNLAISNSPFQTIEEATSITVQRFPTRRVGPMAGREPLLNGNGAVELLVIPNSS